MIAPGLESLAFPVNQLQLLDGNPRQGDVEAVARSYERFGQQKPIVARRTPDGKATVIAGNHQLLAAQQLGWKEIAVVWADEMSDDEARAFSLADNRTAELGGYDKDALAEMLSYVADDADLLKATGWSQKDIDKLVAGPEDLDTDSKLGDVEFRIMVNCLDEEHQRELMARFDDEGLSFTAVMG